MLAIAATLAGWAGSVTAEAASPHVVQPGETLWSIAAANNFTTRTVAAFNGLAEDALVVEGATIEIPTVEEGAAALGAAGITPGSASTSSATPSGTATDPAAPPAPAPGSTYGLGHIPSYWGELHLQPAAAESWNAMRAASLSQFGVDLAPAGPLSAFRTYEQQAYLYNLFLGGQGTPANPPGTSTHELGIAADLADPAMRGVIDQIGAAYGWVGNIPAEWWHVAYVGG
jgi:murein DD-endopeptidase MepM/ murein hydrolase activator NlpD